MLGAAEGTWSRSEPVWGRSIVRARLVIMNTPARIVVARDRTLAEPRGPKAVCVPPPPKALAKVLPLALLEQHDPDQEQACEHVDGDDEVVRDEHGVLPPTRQMGRAGNGDYTRTGRALPAGGTMGAARA